MLASLKPRLKAERGSHLNASDNTLRLIKVHNQYGFPSLKEDATSLWLLQSR